MKYMQLGKTEMEVSRITFGCWEMGGVQWAVTSDDNNIAVVHKALDLGVTSFDTAEGYGKGHSEEVLGKALEGKRKDVVLATKVSKNKLAPGNLRQALQESLKRLRTDYLDLYYIHWPSFEIPLEDTMGELVRMKEQGLIRAIGVSNFDLGLLNQAMSLGRIDAIQPSYSLLHRGIEPAILPWCMQNEVSVMSYASIARGILAGVFHVQGVQLKEGDSRASFRLFSKEHMQKEEPLVRLVKRIADDHGASMSQVAIAWILQKKGMTSAIVGTQSEKHLVDNLLAVDVTLTMDEMAELDKVSAQVLMEIDGSLGNVVTSM